MEKYLTALITFKACRQIMTCDLFNWQFKMRTTGAYYVVTICTFPTVQSSETGLNTRHIYQYNIKAKMCFLFGVKTFNLFSVLCSHHNFAFAYFMLD